MVAPAGQFQYQNAYWLPNAVQAQQVILPERRAEALAEARLQQEQQRAIVREAQVQEALNFELEHCLPQANVPLGCRPYWDPESPHSLGPMDKECIHCGAMHFMVEKLIKSPQGDPKFGVCCLQGQILLPPLPPLPLGLRKLYVERNERSNHFRQNIRQYNLTFAFTSLGAKIDRRVTQSTGPSVFKIHGALCHRMGGLLPLNDADQPKYAQLYIYDPQLALSYRTGANSNLLADILGELEHILRGDNPYVQQYRHAHEILAAKPPEEQNGCAAQIVVAPNTDPRVYNLPTSVEVAAIIPGSGEEDIQEHREVILRLRQAQADDPTRNSLTRISHLHPIYSPLHYVLLFPQGETGWHLEIPTIEMEGRRPRSANVSQLCYYAYRIHWRTNQSDVLFWAGKLFQQYVVDAWASIEESNLCWVRLHQKDLKADTYHGLRDAIATDLPSEDHGHRFILPSSHAGSPRHMYQLFQDSMAICRFCQKPDIFLTMTANPSWPEIKEALLKYQVIEDNNQGRNDNPPLGPTMQTASDRPDIVACVFHKKKMLFWLKSKLASLVQYLDWSTQRSFKRGACHISIY
jgi:hypothetical protein